MQKMSVYSLCSEAPKDLEIGGIRNRVHILYDVEQEFGYVHKGERQWLTSLCDDIPVDSYQDWVYKNMKSLFSEAFHRGIPKEDSPADFEDPENTWYGYTEGVSAFPSLPDNISNLLQLDYLE